MSGPVTIVVRDLEGTVHAFDAWTGYISMFFDNARFLDERPGHLAFFYEEMKNLGCGDVGDADVAPYGYGLVLGDMQEKVILSSQGYHYPGRLIGASVSLSMTGNIIGETEGQTEVDIARELLAAGRIKNARYYTGELQSVEEMTLEEIMEKYHHLRADYRPFDMVIETTPYTIEMFGEDADGIRAMYARVKELGFQLTDEDEAQWKIYIKEFES